MKLIIDIPEQAYKLLNSDEQIDWLGAETLLECIARGTPYEDRPIENKWHDLRENANDLPTKTGWYVCKVKSSHDLRLVFGYEEITQEKFDAWIEVRCSI